MMTFSGELSSFNVSNCVDKFRCKGASTISFLPLRLREMDKDLDRRGMSDSASELFAELRELFFDDSRFVHDSIIASI